MKHYGKYEHRNSILNGNYVMNAGIDTFGFFRSWKPAILQALFTLKDTWKWWRVVGWEREREKERSWWITVCSGTWMIDRRINRYDSAPPPLPWRCVPTRAMASSFLRFLDHTQRRTTVGRTPLDQWSARRRDLLPDNAQHLQQTSMPRRDSNPQYHQASDSRP